MPTIITNPIVQGPFNQIQFLGASVVSANMNLGWNGSQSTLSVTVVEDKNVGTRVTYDNFGNSSILSSVSDAFNPPPVGSYVFFKYSTIEFGGILENWDRRKSESGTIYTIQISDLSSILGNTHVVLNNYTGKTLDVPNIINVYGFLEEFSPTTIAYDTSTYTSTLVNYDPSIYFGGSNRNEAGISWSYVRNALATLFTNETLIELSSDISMIASSVLYYLMSDIPNSRISRFGSLPRLSNTRYILNVHSLPLIDDVLRIEGDHISLLDLIQQVCDYAGCDFFLRTSYIGIYNSNHLVYIEPVVVQRLQQPQAAQIIDDSQNTLIDYRINQGVLQSVVNEASGIINSYDIGLERRDETTNSIIIGDNRQDIWQTQLYATSGEAFIEGQAFAQYPTYIGTRNASIWYYWGEDVNGTVQHSCGTYSNHTAFLNLSGIFNDEIEHALSLATYQFVSESILANIPLIDYEIPPYASKLQTYNGGGTQGYLTNLLTCYPLEANEAAAILADDTGETWKRIVTSETQYPVKKSIFLPNADLQFYRSKYYEYRQLWEAAVIEGDGQTAASQLLLNTVDNFSQYITAYQTSHYAGVIDVRQVMGSKSTQDGVNSALINAKIEHMRHKPYYFSNSNKSFAMGMGLQYKYEVKPNWEHIYQYLKQVVTENYGKKFLVDIPAICSYQPITNKFVDPQNNTISVNNPFEVVTNWDISQGGWTENKLLEGSGLAGFDGGSDVRNVLLSGWNWNDDVITYVRNNDGTIPPLVLMSENTPDEVMPVVGAYDVYDFMLDVGTYSKNKYYLRSQNEGLFVGNNENIVYLDATNKLSPKVLLSIDTPIWSQVIAQRKNSTALTKIIPWRTAATYIPTTINNPNPKRQPELGSDTNILSQTPIPHLPLSVAIPLRSKNLTYGPWVATEGMVYNTNYDNLQLNPAGNTEYIQDHTLNPWTYGNYSAMNALGTMIAQNSTLGQTVIEKGNLTVAGMPNGVQLGDSIVGYGIALNGDFIGVNTEYRTLGPEITNMDISVSEGGVTTSYTMRTFTPNWEFKNKKNIDRFSKLLQTDFRTELLLRKQRMIESRALIRSNYPGLSAFTKGDTFSRQSSHYLLIGENTPNYDITGVDNISTDGSRSQSTAFTSDLRKIAPEIAADDAKEYLHKHVIEGIGCFRPFTTRVGYNTAYTAYQGLASRMPTALTTYINAWSGLDWTSFNNNASQAQKDAVTVISGITTWDDEYLFDYLDFYAPEFVGDTTHYYNVTDITGILDDNNEEFTNAHSGDYVKYAPTQSVGPHFNDNRLPITVHTLNPFLNDGYPSPYGSEGKNKESGMLLGVSSGHDIEYIVRDGVMPLDLNIGMMGESGYSDDHWYRGLGMRGPLVMVGWGYDVDGYPTPNKNWSDTNVIGEATNSGISDFRSMQFEDRWLEKSHKWKTGPVDLRWDEQRGVWSAPQFKTQLLKSLGTNGNISGLPNGFVNAVMIDDDENELMSIGPTGQIQKMEVAAYDANGNAHSEGEKFWAFYDANATSIGGTYLPNYAKYKVLSGGAGGIPIYQVETVWPSSSICGSLPLGKIVGWSSNGNAARSGEIVAFPSGSLPNISGWTIPAIADGGNTYCSCDHSFASFSVLSPPHIWEKGTYVGRINIAGFGLQPTVRIDRFNGAMPVVTGCENPSLSGYIDCHVVTSTWLAGCLTDNPGYQHGPIEAWVSGLPVIITWHPMTDEWEITNAGGFVPKLGTLI